MRRKLLIASIVLVVGLVLYGFLRVGSNPTEGRSTRNDTRHREASPDDPARPTREQVFTHPIATEISPLNSPDTTAEDDLGTLELVIAEYAKANGGNPTGENVEFAAALLGTNPKKIAYLPASGPFLDSSNQLIDRWGTPYFFHQISADHTEIMSAGPDRQFNTADDLKR